MKSGGGLTPAVLWYLLGLDYFSVWRIELWIEDAVLITPFFWSPSSSRSMPCRRRGVNAEAASALEEFRISEFLLPGAAMRYDALRCAVLSVEILRFVAKLMLIRALSRCIRRGTSS